MSTTIAFILGIMSVIVFAAIVMGVIAFFKVIKLKKKVVGVEESMNNSANQLYTRIDTETSDLYHNITNMEKSTGENLNEIYHQISINVDELNKNIEKLNDDVYRTIDSRFNKFENKI